MKQGSFLHLPIGELDKLQSLRYRYFFTALCFSPLWFVLDNLSYSAEVKIVNYSIELLNTTFRST